MVGAQSGIERSRGHLDHVLASRPTPPIRVAYNVPVHQIGILLYKSRAQLMSVSVAKCT